MNRFDALQNKLNELAEDFLKFYEKNNKAAGTRVRKGMQELKNMAQEVRKDVQEKKSKLK
ncbi:MAG: histone H1 [Bacteroidetes bacterium]|nr:histone H1 [Bacteroidota bacterium]